MKSINYSLITFFVLRFTICVLCFTFCVLRFAIQDVSAQEEHVSRLYIPVSVQLTIVKTNDSQALLVKDYLNSTREEIDGSGKSVRENQYLPFGDSITRHPLEGEDPGNIIDKLFTNHRKLENLSVYHAGARFYSPTTGQFIQPDRVEGVNRYAYVRNNPISNSDPTGNETKGIYAQIPDTDFKSKDFPKRLPLVDGTLVMNGGQPLWKSYLDKDLNAVNETVSWEMRNENVQSLEYISSLVTFLYDNAPYNSNFKYFWDKQEELNKRNTQFFIGFSLLKDPNLTRLEKSYEDREDLEWTGHRNMLLMEKVIQHKMICTDFASLTTYLLAQQGIPSAIVTNSEIHHAFNLAEVNNRHYIVDATWGGRVEELTRTSSHGNFSDFKIYEPYGDAFTLPFFTQKKNHAREVKTQ